MTGSVGLLALSVAVFVASHIVLSAPPVRSVLRARLGTRGFQGAYSVLSLVLIVWVVMAYNDAPYVEVWQPATWGRHLALTLMLFACVFVALGLTTPSPTAVSGADGGSGLAGRGPIGILKVTRHPTMWGVVIWGVAHLFANGGAADVLLFGGMTVLALVGAYGIDVKKRASLGDAWTAFARRTSFVPFAAMIQGRTRVSLGEIGWWRLALGVALYGVLLWVHPWLFGVSPFAA